jgi:hypothetical protein
MSSSATVPAIRASASVLEGAAARLPAILLIGGCLNGFAVRIIETLTTDGLNSLTLGLSPFELIALLVAAKLGLKPGTLPAGPVRLGWCEIAALVVLVLPSSAASWAAVALYAVVHLVRSAHGGSLGNDRDQQTAALLFLALALCALWSSVALKALAGPVTSAEAFIVGQLVALVRPDIVQSGNVIGNPATHSLILMTACTTANGLPVALLALVAVTCLLGGGSQRLPRAAISLALFYAVTNIVRLAIMSLSGDAYALAHGPIGANIFDGLQTLAVLVLGNWASRP